MRDDASLTLSLHHSILRLSIQHLLLALDLHAFSELLLVEHRCLSPHGVVDLIEEYLVVFTFLALAQLLLLDLAIEVDLDLLLEFTLFLLQGVLSFFLFSLFVSLDGSPFVLFREIAL